MSNAITSLFSPVYDLRFGMASQFERERAGVENLWVSRLLKSAFRYAEFLPARDREREGFFVTTS